MQKNLVSECGANNQVNRTRPINAHHTQGRRKQLRWSALD